ncbi:MAG: hypothetical protein KKH99_07045, partial [Proteobacteria bacterium]|nr:hypothetical protein [Pseudomonadota bacterium]
EMGLITDLPRTACAIASEYCDLVIIDKKTLHKMVKQSPKLVQAITLFLMKRLGGTLHLLEHNKTEDIGIRNFICICHLLDLACENNRPVDYHRFCTKAKGITHLNLGQVRQAMDRLNQANLIKITTDKKGVILDNAEIRIIGDNAFFLQAAKRLN